MLLDARTNVCLTVGQYTQALRTVAVTGDPSQTYGDSVFTSADIDDLIEYE